MADFHDTFNQSPHQPYWGDNVHPPLQNPETGPIGELSADNATLTHSPTPTYPSLASTYVQCDGMKSPGLSSVVDTEYEKEAVGDQVHTAAPTSDPRESEKKTICGIRRPWFLLVLIAATCIAIAVGVSLGVVLGRKKSGSQSSPSNQSASAGPDNSSIPASVTPSYYSTTGAFNGTGVAVAGESFGTGGHGATNMYFQHHTGQLRVIQLAADGSWKGGSTFEIVATNAKNGTPISAVSYAFENKAAWHIFYVDTNNKIAERIQDNVTNIWADGPIGELGLKAVDDPNVALQACWYGSYYGNITYYNNSTSNQTDQTVGMHLWYGNTGSSIQEVSWLVGADEWTTEYLFEGFNGHGGIGCYSWGYGSVTYVMMVNLYSQVEVWWKDLNTTLTSTSVHPINSWQNSSCSIPDVQQNTSLGYTDFFFMQHADLSVGGYNVSWAAENTSLVTADTFTIRGSKGMPGTHLTCTALPDNSGGASLLVFFQTNGSDVTEYERDLGVGQWTTLEIPIPQD